MGKRKNPEGDAVVEDDENIVTKVTEEDFVPLDSKKKKNKQSKVAEEVPIEKRREDDLPMSLKQKYA